MASGVRKPPRQAEQMPANGQPANDQLKTLAKGAPSTDARIAEPPTWEARFRRSNGFAARICAGHFQFTWVALAETFALSGE